MYQSNSRKSTLAVAVTAIAMVTGLGGCASLGDDGFLSMLYGAASIVASENGNTAGAAQLQSAALAHAAAADGTITSAEAEDQVASLVMQGNLASSTKIPDTAISTYGDSLTPSARTSATSIKRRLTHCISQGINPTTGEIRLKNICGEHVEYAFCFTVPTPQTSKQRPDDACVAIPEHDNKYMNGISVGSFNDIAWSKGAKIALIGCERYAKPVINSGLHSECR